MKIFIGIGIFIGAFLLIYIMNGIGNLLNVKIKKEKIKVSNQRIINLEQGVRSTIQILNLIDQLIELEINRMLDSLSSLGKRYEFNNVNNNAEEISKIVFDGLKKENVLMNSDILLTPDYVSRYIAEETIRRILNRTREYNQVFDRTVR